MAATGVRIPVGVFASPNLSVEPANGRSIVELANGRSIVELANGQ